MEKKCEYCSKQLINGHIVARIDLMKHIFCDQRRVMGDETCVDKYLIQHPIKYSYFVERVQ